MNLKIRGGTVNHGEPPLCTTCRFAAVVKGPRLGDELTSCGHHMLRDRRIPFPVYACSVYVDRSHPSLWHMEEIGWVLRSSPSGKKIGFVEARKLDDDERHVIEE
jgi:hypothetical protein